MGIIRRKPFTTISTTQTNIELVDTPERLIAFAKEKGIKIVPLNVFRVAKEFNIEVQHASFDNDLSGILYEDEETDKWVIKVNKFHHINRQRYTIAHELGHYCLHRFDNNLFEDEIFFREGGSSKTEWQANNFASAILMPEDVFREKVHSGVSEVGEIAKIFEVSSLAVRLRAKNLGMSGHGL